MQELMLVTRETTYTRPWLGWSLDMLIHTSPSADVHRSLMNYNAWVCATHVCIRPRSRFVSVVSPHFCICFCGSSSLFLLIYLRLRSTNGAVRPSATPGLDLHLTRDKPCRNRRRVVLLRDHEIRGDRELVCSESREFNDVANKRSFSRLHFDVCRGVGCASGETPVNWLARFSWFTILVIRSGVYVCAIW